MYLQYSKPGEFKIPDEFVHLLSDNVDILTSRAERFYYNCDFHQCLETTDR